MFELASSLTRPRAYFDRDLRPIPQNHMAMQPVRNTCILHNDLGHLKHEFLLCVCQMLPTLCTE
jgi:hypothetical protein